MQLANKAGMETIAKEPGSISYKFYEDKDNNNSFFFFEEWRDKAAFEAHLEKRHTKNLIDKYTEILEVPADIVIYDVSNVNKILVPEKESDS